jgi:hypothetical protein
MTQSIWKNEERAGEINTGFLWVQNVNAANGLACSKVVSAPSARHLPLTTLQILLSFYLFLRETTIDSSLLLSTDNA